MFAFSIAAFFLNLTLYYSRSVSQIYKCATKFKVKFCIIICISLDFDSMKVNNSSNLVRALTMRTRIPNPLFRSASFLLCSLQLVLA